MLQDPLNHHWLAFVVYQGDYLHSAPAVWTLQVFELVYQFYQGSPCHPEPERLLGQGLCGAGNQREFQGLLAYAAAHIVVPEQIAIAGFDNRTFQSLQNRPPSYNFNVAGFMHCKLSFIIRPRRPLLSRINRD